MPEIQLAAKTLDRLASADGKRGGERAARVARVSGLRARRSSGRVAANGVGAGAADR